MPSPYAGNVLTRHHILISNAISFIPFAILLSGVGMVLAAIFVDEMLSIVTRVTFGITGAAVVGAAVFWMNYYVDYLGSNYQLRVCRREFERRSDCWVDFRDPVAIVVQNIPRENWGRMMLENATDVGFLKIDRDRRELLFEGDKERYRIPAEAIVSCRVESFRLSADQSGNPYFMTTVESTTADRTREISLSHRHVHRKRRGAIEREQLAVELRDMIRAMMPPKS